jgi:hypothetical protein
MTRHIARADSPNPNRSAPEAPTPLVSDAVAFLVAALVYLFARGGLVPPDASGAVLVGALTGVLASFSASSAVRAGVASGLAVLLGAVVAPVFGLAILPWAIVAALVAGVAALATRLTVDTGRVRPALVLALVVALVIASFWLSTVTLARDQHLASGPTLFEFLDAPPAPGSKQPDQMFYNAVLFKMRAGEDYYPAYRQAFHENGLWGADPPTIISVREPLLPDLLVKLPGGMRGPIWGLTLLASVAIVAAIALPRNLADPSVRCVSVVAVAAYLLAFTTTPLVIGFEAWGACLGVLSAALFAISMERTAADSRRHWLLIVAAALAVLAVAVREIMIFLPVAGLAAAFFAEKNRRRFDVSVWGAALAGSLAVWGLHALAARGIITPSDVLRKQAAVFGGFGNVVAAIKYAAFYITTYRPLLVVLALLGIAGAFLQRERQYRVFMVICLLLPLVTFFFAWNSAIDAPTGAQVNYWGVVMGPLLFAMIPAVLGAIPGVGRKT